MDRNLKCSVFTDALRSEPNRRRHFKALSKRDERGKRVFAASEAWAAGWGGVAGVAAITGLARSRPGGQHDSYIDQADERSQEMTAVSNRPPAPVLDVRTASNRRTLPPP
jgi:hypothetical protein